MVIDSSFTGFILVFGQDPLFVSRKNPSPTKSTSRLGFYTKKKVGLDKVGLEKVGLEKASPVKRIRTTEEQIFWKNSKLRMLQYHENQCSLCLSPKLFPPPHPFFRFSEAFPRICKIPYCCKLRTVCGRLCLTRIYNFEIKIFC